MKSQFVIMYVWYTFMCAFTCVQLLRHLNFGHYVCVADTLPTDPSLA